MKLDFNKPIYDTKGVVLGIACEALIPILERVTSKYPEKAKLLRETLAKTTVLDIDEVDFNLLYEVVENSNGVCFPIYRDRLLELMADFKKEFESKAADNKEC